MKTRKKFTREFKKSILRERKKCSTGMPGKRHSSPKWKREYKENPGTAFSGKGNISMSRKGNPYDNAFAESFIKTLKYAEVYLWEYETFDEAHNNIKKFLEVVYNKNGFIHL